ncbi:MAG: QueT transporter family protein [Eubacterium sp.]|nr:QueT transporter family protein [Eubacterium sp.]
MKNKSTLFLTQAAVIAAVYVVLTVVFAPFSFKEIQVRLSEALTILPLFTPAAIPGLFVGCLLGNVLGGAVIWDTVFGSIATLIGAVGTYLLRKKSMYLAPVPPIVSNTVIVPFVLKYAYQVPLPIPFMMLTLGVGEVISCGVLGVLLGKLLKKHEGAIFGERSGDIE